MVVQQLKYSELITINRDSDTAVYLQIAAGLINIIRERLVLKGSMLPSSRQLAEMLNVHRKTVNAAYDELSASGWVQPVPRKGIMVSVNTQDLTPLGFNQSLKAKPYHSINKDFFLKIRANEAKKTIANNYHTVVNDGFPDARIAPVDMLMKQYYTFLKKSHIQGQFMLGDITGSYNLRKEIAVFLTETRGLNIDTEHVLITRGAQMAIYIAAQMIIKPGDTVIVGEPGYFMANRIFKHFGATLIHVKVDEQGIDVDAISKICEKKRPNLLYVIPHHHHPTTVTLSADRRLKLLSLIRKYELPVIEDDYDYDYHYNKSPILPLASADHNGYVLYIGSLTKSFASALRIGYLVAGAALIWQAAALREMIDIRGDILMEEALAALYKNGHMQKHLNKAVKTYRQRRDHFCNLLSTELNDAVSFDKPSGGMSVWVKFNTGYNLPEIAYKAAKNGIYMNDGIMYNTGNTNYNALRMGFASMNEMEMEELVKTLKTII